MGLSESKRVTKARWSPSRTELFSLPGEIGLLRLLESTPYNRAASRSLSNEILKETATGDPALACGIKLCAAKRRATYPEP